MDFIKAIVDQNHVADIIRIDEHKLRVIYKSDYETFESELSYDQYRSEEELAAVINTEFDRKTQGKINTSFK